MEKAYKYDAFISYRHVSPDKPIAERLQKLLETYVPPKGVRAEGDKKKLHLFRDETELPTSNDLGGDIRRALEDSRFLVVICSPEYEKSKWCMEEVRYFKELHGGSNRNILTILADDPDVRPAFPEALRFETVTETADNGETVTFEREIEPLAANVCAKTERQMLKKLKSEFLRIAAPLLGCGYDDLYHREQRRATQRKLRFAFGTAAVLAAGVLLSTAALLTIRAKNQQIAADALELRKNNADLLLKESEMLEKDGDLYGALQAAVQAYPDDSDGFAPAPGTLMQLASLTGAYTPQSFAPERKIEFSAIPERVYLFEGGARLIAVTSGGAEIADTSTGEIILSIPGATRFKTVFYRCSAVESISIDHFAQGVLMQDENGLVGGFKKRVQQEAPVAEQAFYAIDDSTKTVARIDPETGEDIWRVEKPSEFGRLPLDTLISNEGIPYICSSDGIALLAPENGNVSAWIKADVLSDAIGTGSLKEAFYAREHLIVTYTEEGSLCFAVFRKTEDAFTFVFKDTLVEGETLAGTTFAVEKDTLMAAAEYYPTMFDNTVLFAGYDLATGLQKWSFSETDHTGGDPALGYIEPDKGANNPFPVAFAVDGDHLFAVNAETGALLSYTLLPGEVTDMYYSENGMVFFTLDKGVEIFTPLRRFTGENDEIRLYKNDEFGARIARAAYSGNTYAVCRGNESLVLLYRPLENDNKQVAFQDKETDGHVMTDFVLSPDHTLCSLQLYDPNEVYVADMHTGEPVQKISFGEKYPAAISFLGNSHIAVMLSDGVQIYDVETGELVREFTNDDYDLSLVSSSRNEKTVADSEGNLYLISKENGVMRIVCGEEPEQVTDFAFAEEGLEDPGLSVEMLRVSPAGDKLFLCFKATSYESDTATMLRMAVYDMTERKAVLCTLPEGDDFYELFYQKYKASEFTADGSAVYMLRDRMLVGFSCDTGEVLCNAPLDVDAVDLVTIGNDPCVLTSDAVLIRLQAEGENAVRTGSISCGLNANNGQLYYASQGNGIGVLRYLDTAWLIDETAFAAAAEIGRFAGIDTENGLVYQNYYTTVYSYPLYADADLLALAKARLGE